MTESRKYIFYVSALVLFVCHFQIVSAQTDIDQEPDTSDYLPGYIEDYKNYNLMIAASQGYVTEIKRLIEDGADINGFTDEGVTPIMFAVQNNKPEAVKALLRYNPILDKLTYSSETPLIVAAKNHYFEIAEALIRAGADVDFPDRNGASPLHYAALNGYFDIVDLLLYYNAKVDEKSDEGITPLLAAIMAGYANVADLLIQNGANMEARNKEGYTPFLMAAVNGDTLIMDLLFRKGVDIYAFNNERYNALDLSISTNQTVSANYLLKIGNKWGRPGGEAVSPYKIAEKYRRTEMVKMLREHKIEGQIRYAIDQVAFTPSVRFVPKDIYSGIGFSFKEPYLNAGFVAGCDMKIWYTRVLVKKSENLYYQYWDRGYLAYAGIFKDIILHENPFGSKTMVTITILGGYSFGHSLKGTRSGREEGFHLIPSVAYKWNYRNFTASLGAEYVKTQFIHNGPLWLRAGLSYTLYLDKVRTQIKPIKWY